MHSQLASSAPNARACVPRAPPVPACRALPPSLLQRAPRACLPRPRAPEPCAPAPVPPSAPASTRPCRLCARLRAPPCRGLGCALCRDTACLMAFPSHNTMQCIAIHCSLLPAPSISIQNFLAIQFFFPTNYTSLQYNMLYCNTISSPQAFFFAIQKLYCNTIFNTHSTCNTLHTAIQFQSCNTNFVFSQYNWAVA